jgi:hypothetical protein
MSGTQAATVVATDSDIAWADLRTARRSSKRASSIMSSPATSQVRMVSAWASTKARIVSVSSCSILVLSSRATTGLSGGLASRASGRKTSSGMASFRVVTNGNASLRRKQKSRA